MKVSWLKFLNLMEDIKEKYERIFKNKKLKNPLFYKWHNLSKEVVIIKI